MLKTFCLHFCHINAWIAVFTLAVFVWIAHEEPRLLEIEQDSVEKGRDVLLFGTIAYAVIAALLAVYVCFIRSTTEKYEAETMRFKEKPRSLIKSKEKHPSFSQGHEDKISDNEGNAGEGKGSGAEDLNLGQ